MHGKACGARVSKPAARARDIQAATTDGDDMSGSGAAAGGNCPGSHPRHGQPSANRE